MILKLLIYATKASESGVAFMQLYAIHLEVYIFFANYSNLCFLTNL